MPIPMQARLNALRNGPMPAAPDYAALAASGRPMPPTGGPGQMMPMGPRIPGATARGPGVGIPHPMGPRPGSPGAPISPPPTGGVLPPTPVPPPTGGPFPPPGGMRTGGPLPPTPYEPPGMGMPMPPTGGPLPPSPVPGGQGDPGGIMPPNMRPGYGGGGLGRLMRR